MKSNKEDARRESYKNISAPETTVQKLHATDNAATLSSGNDDGNIKVPTNNSKHYSDSQDVSRENVFTMTNHRQKEFE